MHEARWQERNGSALVRRLVDGGLRGLRSGVRSIERTPEFAATVVLSLTLGLGATTAVHGVLKALWLRPLPFPAAEQLVEIHRTDPRSPSYRLGTTLHDLAVWRAESTSLDAISGWQWARHHLQGPGNATYVWGLEVDAHFFTLLGVSAAAGRTLTADDVEQGRLVAVISHRLWRQHFGADDAAVGSTVVLDDVGYEVVGVMDPSFAYPPYTSQVVDMAADVWRPLSTTLPPASRVSVLARVRNSASTAQAAGELHAARMQSGGVAAAGEVLLTPLAARVSAPVRPALLLLAIIVVCVLAVACVNVATLLLVRATARTRHTALRLALGARPGDLLAESISENLVLTAIACVLGLTATHYGIQALLPHVPHNMPGVETVGLTPGTVGVALAAAVAIAVVLATVVPIVARRVNISRAMQAEDTVQTVAGGTVRLTGVLAVGQVAVATMILVGAGAAVQSLLALQSTDMGFAPRRVVMARIMPPRHAYRTAADVRQLHQRVLDNVQALGGVQSAALVMSLPLSGRSVQTRVRVDGTDYDVSAERNIVSEQYFETMGIPVLAGRAFQEDDGPGSERVVIVNRQLARQLWPSADPLGGRLRHGGAVSRVIGVVGDEKHLSLDQAAPAKYYALSGQEGESPLMEMLAFLVARTDQDATTLVPDIKHALTQSDPTLPVDDVMTMTNVVATATAVPRLRAVLIAVLALLALVVSSVGVYGVVAHHVTRRRRDIAVRMTLGAEVRQIVREVVVYGVRIGVVGTGCGLLLATGLVRLGRSQLYGVSHVDIRWLAGAAVVMTAVTICACLVPSYRAARIEPLETLRRQ